MSTQWPLVGTTSGLQSPGRESVQLVPAFRAAMGSRSWPSSSCVKVGPGFEPPSAQVDLNVVFFRSLP